MCEGCSYKNKCRASSGSNATIYIDDGGVVMAKMAEKMKSKYSRKIYGELKIIVKPVFGQIKTGGFKRFSLRGLEKAGGEFSLVCAVSNFKKIAKKIKANKGCPKDSELVFQMI